MRALIASLLLATATIASPAVLLGEAGAPSGFVSLGDDHATQTFAEFAENSPYSVGHVEAGSPDTDGFMAGQDVWTLGEDDSLLREVSIWKDPKLATGYIEQVVEYAVGLGLRATDPPFDGALEFTGTDPDTQIGTHIVVWQHGRVGLAISHFHNGGETTTAVVDEASQMLADAVTAETGVNVGEDMEQETVTTNDDGTPTSGGGIPIGTVLLWMAIIIGGIWLFVKIRNKVRGTEGGSSGPRSTDEIVDDARSDARSEQPAEPAPDRPAADDRSTDEVIAEARRRAREEVDSESDTWQIPDDY